ncbi:hypothetical protein [Streptomyces sp. NRRL WC-3742]|uniref:hypothetical protein n=1 Tax=Streptomyces sp. NRRL WC-3742 TaxID=1463934 RepID=UPI0004CB9F2D|nr:hypothetical protein [Streptomyces sp. NRRL WC-3742]
MTSTLTRRPASTPTVGAAALARHIARVTTAAAPRSWTESSAEQRFAAELAALTGTDAGMWLEGEYAGNETRRRLLAQSADAIVRTDSSIELILPAEAGDDWAELEAEIANEAAADAALEAATAARTRVTAKAARRELAREHALKHYTERELAAFGDDPLDAWGKDVRDVVEAWSPFRADRSGRDPRGCHVVRCRDGLRRYPDGSLAD